MCLGLTVHVRTYGWDRHKKDAYKGWGGGGDFCSNNNIGYHAN